MFRVQQPHWCNAPHVRNVVMGYEKNVKYMDSHGSQASLGLGQLWPMSFDASAEQLFHHLLSFLCTIVWSRRSKSEPLLLLAAMQSSVLWAISGCGGKHRLVSMRPPSPSNVSWKQSADQCQSRRSHCRQGRACDATSFHYLFNAEEVLKSVVPLSALLKCSSTVSLVLGLPVQRSCFRPARVPHLGAPFQ